MCQARPGLRCSRHALDHLRKEEAKLADILAKYNKVKNGRGGQKDALLAEITVTQMKIARAEQDYYTTKEGIQVLEDSLAEPNIEPMERAKLESQLKLAKYDMSNQKLAYLLHRREKAKGSEGLWNIRKSLIDEENKERENLARALLPGKDATKSKEQMHVVFSVEKKRRFIEEKIRVASLPGADVASIRYGLIGDIKPDSSDSHYIFLDKGYFGNTSSYFPIGSYAKITRIEPQGEGFVVEIEGLKDKPVSSNQRIALMP